MRNSRSVAPPKGLREQAAGPGTSEERSDSDVSETTSLRPTQDPPPAELQRGHKSVVVVRNRLIDEKVQRAREQLATVSHGSREGRLLHAAIVRRDETLLDELLSRR